MNIRVAICLVAFANTAAVAPATQINIFDYGIASNGPITMTGNDQVKGANNAAEANILSATLNTTALTMTGNARMQGDFYATNPAGQANLTGNISVGGASGADVANHIHFGIGDVTFPEVDPTVFEPFATNIVDGTTSTAGNKTFTNIRIKAGTNPNFSGNITIKGVVYIEKPNKVSFAGNLSLTGIVVTDMGHDVTDNQINFTGNTLTSGVEYLPDTPEFHALRTMTGSFILAPGFNCKFTGNIGIVNGCMAAEGFTLTGNAGGLIYGSLINYGTGTLAFTGNTAFTFDRSADVARSQEAGTSDVMSAPAGFAPVPEPATLTLLAFGGLGVMLRSGKAASGTTRMAKSTNHRRRGEQ